ncbi:hypothetical protein ACFQ6Q_38840 [Streptomyces sp. NPDC056437]|uniref:hypothetical protein n=1 Tax=Streptomyces sp. NPDC056437 TaxID=3345816 RepID=UPI003682595F
MSEQPASESAAQQQLDPAAADAVRAYAAAERAKTDTLASVLEDIAANGYPSPETGVPWETARDAHLADLAGEQTRVA